MKIFLSLRVTADAGGGLKNRAHLRPVLQGFGGGQPPTSTRRVYTGALLAATIFRCQSKFESQLILTVSFCDVWDFELLPLYDIILEPVRRKQGAKCRWIEI